MATYERPSAPQGNVINLRAQPLQDSVTSVKVYQGGTAGVVGTGTLLATIAASAVSVAQGEYLAPYVIANDAVVGSYYDDWTYVFGGVTQPVVRLAGFAVSLAPSLGTGAVTQYPFGYGYCDVSDVTGNISGGAWNPYAPDAAPDLPRTQVLILNAATEIDMVLAKRGYLLPVQPVPGKTVMQQAWRLLLRINADLATAMVEAERYGSQGDQSNDVARWQTYADDLLTRLAEAEDLLTQFNVAQAGWVPVADPGAGLFLGGQTAVSGDTMQPIFSVSDDTLTRSIGDN